MEINRSHGLPWDEAKTELEWATMLHARDLAGDREATRQRRARARQLFEQVGARREVERVLATGS